MGPADDKIQVEDRLPMPLTVHLGAGSDKFLGNDEPDTCYSEANQTQPLHRLRRRRHLHHRPPEQRLRRRRGRRLLQAPGGQRRLLRRPRGRRMRHGRRQDGCHGGPGTTSVRRRRARPALWRRRQRLLRRRTGGRAAPTTARAVPAADGSHGWVSCSARSPSGRAPAAGGRVRRRRPALRARRHRRRARLHPGLGADRQRPRRLRKIAQGDLQGAVDHPLREQDDRRLELQARPRAAPASTAPGARGRAKKAKR